MRCGGWFRISRRWRARSTTHFVVSSTQGFPSPGRCFAANRDVAPLQHPVAQLWQHCTTLREHRGDGHVAALASAGIDGCQAHQLLIASQNLPVEVFVPPRQTIRRKRVSDGVHDGDVDMPAVVAVRRVLPSRRVGGGRLAPPGVERVDADASVDGRRDPDVASLNARDRETAKLTATGAIVVDARPGELATDVVDRCFELKAKGRL